MGMDEVNSFGVTQTAIRPVYSGFISVMFKVYFVVVLEGIMEN